MNKAIKAALLSALVFPGAGQLYLKRYLRGIIMALLALLGLGFIVFTVFDAVMRSVMSMQLEGKAMDANTIAQLAAASSGDQLVGYNIILFLILCCWIFSVADAYMIGKRRSLPENQPPKPPSDAQNR